MYVINTNLIILYSAFTMCNQWDNFLNIVQYLQFAFIGRDYEAQNKKSQILYSDENNSILDILQIIQADVVTGVYHLMD